MARRATFLTVLLVTFQSLLALASRSAPLPAREPLIGLPMEIAEWTGHNGTPLDARVLAVLGADDYVTRVYEKSGGAAVGLYIGYHSSQRQDDSIHSPMNCLPGAGWLASRSDRVAIADNRGAAPTATVNRVEVQKGDERQIALYWYQSQGRVVASEYASKVYLFADALRSRRTDAALVRIMIPVRAPLGDQAAQDQAQSFAELLLPLLGRHLPN